MASNYVDHVFGSELDRLLAANRIGKRVPRPKRLTKPRQWPGLHRKFNEPSASDRFGDLQSSTGLAGAMFTAGTSTTSCR